MSTARGTVGYSCDCGFRNVEKLSDIVKFLDAESGKCNQAVA
jgi:hypothetical protein